MTGDAIALASLLASRKVSAIEIVRASLERIQRSNSQLNAIVALDEHGAITAAERSEQRQMNGSRLGVLDGVPITVKDNLFVRGLPATWGSRLFEGYEPTVDDLVVDRLRAAGAIIIGKTNTPEFALDNETTNLVFGTTVNPWDVRLTPGGSSGGAAVSVAAGMVPLALGTDSGGSIRQPAGFTGVLGLKPSVGRIARAYGFPALVADFQVIGLLARTVADLTLFASLAAGPDPRDRASLAFSKEDFGKRPDPARWTILVVSDFGGHPVEGPIRESIERAAAAFSDMGHAVERGTLPFELEPLFQIWRTLSDVGAARVVNAAPEPRPQLGAVVGGAAARGLRIDATAYLGVLDELAKFRLDLTERWRHFDVVLGPSSASMPWPADPSQQSEEESAAAPYVSMFNKLANATGYPSISIPGDPAPSGLPIGVQLLARYGEDDLLLSLARGYETVKPWVERFAAVSSI